MKDNIFINFFRVTQIKDQLAFSQIILKFNHKTIYLTVNRLSITFHPFPLKNCYCYSDKKKIEN